MNQQETEKSENAKAPANPLDSLVMCPEDLFPFEYVGTGYFRLKGVPKGISAPMLHGRQVVDYIYSRAVLGIEFDFVIEQKDAKAPTPNTPSPEKRRKRKAEA